MEESDAAQEAKADQEENSSGGEQGKREERPGDSCLEVGEKVRSAYVGVDLGARAPDSVEVGEVVQGIHTGGDRVEGELEVDGSEKVDVEVGIEEARLAEESRDSHDLGF